MTKKENCFIIMPITTSDAYLPYYRDGEEHFQHVLNYLFIPAVEQAGYKSISPISEGSDIIHAEIIKNIESSEIVLCDISTLNPNVLFEIGIRTSLNKPVCIIKDDITDKVPFDISIIKYHEYDSSLDAWSIDSEIGNISKHLITSVKKSNGENQLWKHFGFKKEDVPFTTATLDSDKKLDYLIHQIEVLRPKIHNEPDNPNIFDYMLPPLQTVKEADYEKPQVTKYPDIEKTFIADYIRAMIHKNKAVVQNITREGNSINIWYKGEIPPETTSTIIETLGDIYHFKIKIYKAD